MITLNDLKSHKPKYNFFIGIDSDGTVFDTMNLKHSYCFVDSLVSIYNLSKIRSEVVKLWKKINLYSKYRGINRFEALYIFFENFKKNKDFEKNQISFPNLKVIKNLSELNIPLTNENLLKFSKNHSKKNQELNDIERAIIWSKDVNKNVEKLIIDLPPIQGAVTAIKYLYNHSDMAVLSNTPAKTLLNDWNQNNIKNLVSFICGHETGSKTEMLKAAIKRKYDRDKVMMIGDSPSDFYAAKNNNALFFPIIPGSENDSWNFLVNEGIPNFFSLKYRSKIQKEKILEFESSINAKL